MTRPWTCIAVGAYLLARACAQVSDDVVTSADYYYDYDSVEEPPEPARAPEASPVAPSPEPPIPPPSSAVAGCDTSSSSSSSSWCSSSSGTVLPSGELDPAI